MTDSFGYSVRVKTGAGWRRHGRVRLMISVGKEYHEGAKLKAAVDWINRNPTIREVHVSVNDHLQRHNLVAAGMSEQRAGAVALAEGVRWMERNAGILAEIKAAGWYTTRWRDWFDRPDFAARLAALSEYARADAGRARAHGSPPDRSFDDALDADARALAERRVKRGEPIANLERLIVHSRDYVREELAVFAMQAAERPAAEVYPGSNLQSAMYLLDKELPEAIRPLASRYFTRIDFARINLAPEPERDSVRQRRPSRLPAITA
ncbi:MAG: hypothetical protein WB764_30060 [Xanthobacteraceae bacterium]|jgi:hypothetical protein